MQRRNHLLFLPYRDVIRKLWNFPNNTLEPQKVDFFSRFSILYTAEKLHINQSHCITFFMLYRYYYYDKDSFFDFSNK